MSAVFYIEYRDGKVTQIEFKTLPKRAQLIISIARNPMSPQKPMAGSY